MLAHEFRCSRCFLVCHRSQRVPDGRGATSAASVPDRRATLTVTRAGEHQTRTLGDSHGTAPAGSGGVSLAVDANNLVMP
jgi:hypothetical protein